MQPTTPKRRGAPVKALEDRKDVKVVTQRMEGAARREKFRKLGRTWLEQAVDRAKLPD